MLKQRWLDIMVALTALAALSSAAHPQRAVSPSPAPSPQLDAKPAPTGSGLTARTPDEMARWFQGCWRTWSEDWRRLDSCYDEAIVSEEPGSGSPPWRGRSAVMGHVELFKHVFPDATGELELVLVNGRRMAGIAIVSGTHAGEMKRPGGVIPPTQKRLSIPVGHLLEVGDSGKSVHELIFLDHASLWGQLGLFPGPHRPAAGAARVPPPVVVAANDERERRNLAAYQLQVDQLNARGRPSLEAGMAADLRWSELALPADLDRRGALAHLDELWSGFSDLRWSASESWAAGPYVVAVGLMTGTNDGDLPLLHLSRSGRSLSLPFFQVAKFEAGKLVSSWFFYDGMGLLGQLAPAASGAD